MNWHHNQHLGHSNYTLRFPRTSQHYNPSWAYRTQKEPPIWLQILAALGIAGLGFLSMIVILGAF